MHGSFTPSRRARIVRRDDTWTYRESEILREHWPDFRVLMTLLPHRSENAIRYMAKRCGLIPPKQQNIWTGAQDKQLRQMAVAGATRKEIATELGLTVLQVTNRLNYRRISIAKRPPKPIGNQILDQIRRRAFDLNISATELDRSLGRRKIFQRRNPRVDPVHIHRAVKALGGVLKIEWIDE